MVDQTHVPGVEETRGSMANGTLQPHVQFQHDRTTEQIGDMLAEHHLDFKSNNANPFRNP